jgi:hypothetical protein
MELAGRYEFSLSERFRFFVYGGPVGEAALGPAAFPHRLSASENPLAPLGHHMQDSTHISVNVMTVGFSHSVLQMEASGFHGGEPNENRWNIDKGKPDSFAGRLTIAPNKNISAQFSTSRINEPERGSPGDTVRTTASLHHSVGFRSGHVSTSLIWGRNKDLNQGSRRIFNSYNLEVSSKFQGRNWFWARIENVDRDRSLLPVEAESEPACRLCGVLGFAAPATLPGKPDEALVFEHILRGPDGAPVVIEEDPIGRVQAYTVGFEREIPIGLSWVSAGLGIQATTYRPPSHLHDIYTKAPGTFVVFLRFRPRGNMSDHMKLMHQTR